MDKSAKTAPRSVYSWTITGWLVVTFAICATHIFLSLTGPPDELVMANTLWWKLMVVAIFYVVPSIALLAVVLFIEWTVLEKMRSNITPQPDARGAAVQSPVSSGARADGRGR